jgi:hypothetical protein
MPGTRRDHLNETLVRPTPLKIGTTTVTQAVQPIPAPCRDRREPSVRPELRQLNKAQLYERATEHNITGRSKMSREELIDALARAGRRRKNSAACPGIRTAPVSRTLPEPMLSTPVPTPALRPGWPAEPKWDGFRAPGLPRREPAGPAL